MPGNELVQSLGRGLDLLRLLGESNGGMRLVDVVAATGLKHPTVHNLLRTLVNREFVVHEDGVYRIGPVVPMLAAAAADSAFLKQTEAAVHRLGELLPEAIVSFCEPVGVELLARFHIFPKQMLMQRSGSTIFSPYQTASGLAFLAYADPETRQGVQMRHPFEVEGLQVWQTEAKLEKFLKEIREKGHVLPPFCANSKFRLAACPNLSVDGKLLGVLGAAWHALPTTEEDVTEKALAALCEAAKLVPLSKRIDG